MICSNWLDRLRSTKGFPTADGLDLDHFLSNNNPNPDSNLPESTQPNQKPVADNRKEISSNRNGDDDGESEWFGIMSNVLSDLFNMGGDSEPDRNRRKKSSRKQTNPRICMVSTAAAAVEVEEEEEERSSGLCERKDENSPAENANASNAVDRRDGGGNGDNEEEGEFDKGGGEREFFGFSRNEVMVIDTSSVEWKFEKLVYRKRNVWKVREKKGKSKMVGRKRRKGSGCDGSVDGKKKMKVSNENENGGGGCVSPSKHGPSPQDDKSRGEFGEGSSDDLSQKRASLSRLRKKTKMGCSSVILRKGSPASSKTKSHKNPSSDFEFAQRESVCNKPLLGTLQKGK